MAGNSGTTHYETVPYQQPWPSLRVFSYLDPEPIFKHVKMMLRVRSVSPDAGDSMGYLKQDNPFITEELSRILFSTLVARRFARWPRMKSNLLPPFHKDLAMALSLDLDLPSPW